MLLIWGSFFFRPPIMLSLLLTVIISQTGLQICITSVFIYCVARASGVNAVNLLVDSCSSQLCNTLTVSAFPFEIGSLQPLKLFKVD